ncbi:MAG: AraC family transcriptional regulator [Pseudomonadota bacterium]
MHERSSIAALFEDLAEPFTAEALFDQMPDTVFFIKDAGGRYVCVNQTLVSRCRKRSKSQVLGRTPSAVFGTDLGRDYEAQDRSVIRSGRRLLDKLELHVHRPRELGWCLTSKLPLAGKDGKIVGLVGVSRDLKLPDVASSEFEQIAEAISYAESRLAAPPAVAELAAIASMSAYQLDRRMKRLFGLSTGQWLLKTRIDRASRQLTETALSVTDIALDCGYKDHSAFARQFRRTTGRTPSEFRRWGRYG